MQQLFYERHIFSDSKEAAEALAEAIAADLQQGQDERGEAVLAVSGGCTPRRFFEALSQHDIDWQRVRITLVDERFVPESLERSNARLVRTYLMKGAAASADFVPLYRDDCEADEAAQNPSDDLKTILQRGFDAVVLGLGTDGHTASFFPGGDNLEEALDFAASPKILAMRAEGAGEPRLTFSASALLLTRGLYLQMESEEKRTVFEQACQPGSTTELPIRFFLFQQQRKLDVFEC